MKYKSIILKLYALYAFNVDYEHTHAIVRDHLKENKK